MDNNSNNKRTKKIFIGTKSFGRYDQTAGKMLNDENNGIEIVDDINTADGVIAGTESYDDDILIGAPYLKAISRMGVGYDNIDVDYCLDNNITVTYTPDAPSGSVAELTVAQILGMIRNTQNYNTLMSDGKWHKRIGKLISELTIGVIGVGRIGQRVINLLQPFKPKEIYAIDTDHEKLYQFSKKREIILSQDLKQLLNNSDVVTVHIPGSPENKHLINDDFLCNMKQGSFLVNTSRGSILDEGSLMEHAPKLAGVALDVFDEEPYSGALRYYNNVFMTPHVGSLTLTARIEMETQAVIDCISILNGKTPVNPIPEMRMRMVTGSIKS